MQFWSGTAFMKAADSVAVARMLDEAGYRRDRDVGPHDLPA